MSKEEFRKIVKSQKPERSKWKAQIGALGDNELIMEKWVAGCAALLRDAEDSRQSVETRLTSMVGLASIAGTLVLSSIFALATGGIHAPTFLLRMVMLLGALYLVIQICCAILASVSGLQRKSYIGLKASDIFPLSGESRVACLRRQLILCTRRLERVRFRNKDKVSHMAVAHHAMKNFCWGLVVFALCGGYFALRENPDSSLVNTLKQDHALYELLRGPQGPKGDPGPPVPEAGGTVTRPVSHMKKPTRMDR
jgi:hypothetical protein